MVIVWAVLPACHNVVEQREGVHVPLSLDLEANAVGGGSHSTGNVSVFQMAHKFLGSCKACRLKHDDDLCAVLPHRAGCARGARLLHSFCFAALVSVAGEKSPPTVLPC